MAKSKKTKPKIRAGIRGDGYLITIEVWVSNNAPGCGQLEFKQWVKDGLDMVNLNDAVVNDANTDVAADLDGQTISIEVHE